MRAARARFGVLWVRARCAESQPLSLQRIEGAVETGVFRPRRGQPWASHGGWATRGLQRTLGEEWGVGSMPERGSRREGVKAWWKGCVARISATQGERLKLASERRLGSARHWHTRPSVYYCSNRRDAAPPASGACGACGACPALAFAECEDHHTRPRRGRLALC